MTSDLDDLVVGSRAIVDEAGYIELLTAVTVTRVTQTRVIVKGKGAERVFMKTSGRERGASYPHMAARLRLTTEDLLARAAFTDAARRLRLVLGNLGRHAESSRIQSARLESIEACIEAATTLCAECAS